jgi:DNA-binding NarL/FixJ family response regulator
MIDARHHYKMECVVMTDQKPIRVAIVEDDKSIREGLAALITGTSGFKCIGTFGTMEDGLRGVRQNPPDILLCDIGLPGKTGIEGIAILKEQFPDLLMIVLTIYDDDRRIFDALCAGARGYLLKNTPPARLLESLKEAVHGGAPISPEISLKVINLFRQFAPSGKSNHVLTPHEIRVLQLFVEGHNFKTAATQLGVTSHTISFHMRNIYDKLQVHSKSEAVAKAMRKGLVR